MTSCGRSFFNSRLTASKSSKSNWSRVNARTRQRGANRGAIRTRKFPMSPFAPVIQTSGLVNEPLGEIAIRINPAVAQERPVRARHVHFGEVNGHDQNLFLVRRSFGEDFAGSSGDETLSPKFKAVATHAGNFFVADAVRHGDEAAVGDGVRALDSFPRVVLAFAVFFFLARMPAD